MITLLATCERVIWKLRDITANMEENVDQLAGFPHGLYALLCSLGEDSCREAVWTLRRTKSKFYLDIQWPKKEPFKFPAQKSCEQPHLEKYAKDGPTPPGNPRCDAILKDSAEGIAGVERLAVNRLSVHPESDRPAVPSTWKKRRSPSTRNRLRWE